MLTKRLQGFTLVDLTLIIAILGIIAAAAIPRYMVYTLDTQSVETTHVAQSLTVASLQNYLLRSKKKTDGHPVKNCTDADVLIEGGLPQGYSIASKEVPVNITLGCVLAGPQNSHAMFNATGVE